MGEELGDALVAGVERGEEENELDVAFLHTSKVTHTCTYVRKRREREGEKERGEKEEAYQRREGRVTPAGAWPERVTGVSLGNAREKERVS